MPATVQTVRGTTRLAFDYVEGITTVVEDMHETIARRPLPWQSRPAQPQQAHGKIAAMVYRLLRGANNMVREGVDNILALMPAYDTGHSPGEANVLAALNGVCGDHLEKTGNPLALTMGFTTPEQPLEMEPQALAAAYPEASGHIVVLVHGLCLSELSWHRRGKPDLGSCLQREVGATPVYLRYNTGRHISTNGQEFSRLLEELCAEWPVPVESVSLVGHSMGGLVIRSACWYATQDRREWVDRLRRVVCLGTPHHGAPLEKAGHFFDSVLLSSEYVEPLLFGRHRSVGIKDLRHGNLLDEDWRRQSGAAGRKDRRRPVPLLPDVDYHFVAATVGRHEQDLTGHVLGDLLVRTDSARGKHHKEHHLLDVGSDNIRVFHNMHHFGLLHDKQVQRQIIDWFK